jgi:hypothetical protein
MTTEQLFNNHVEPYEIVCRFNEMPTMVKDNRLFYVFNGVKWRLYFSSATLQEQWPEKFARKVLNFEA